MPTLEYNALRDAVAGGAVAFRSITKLQPAGGPGDKVFPASYAVENRAEHKYAVEDRIIGDQVTTTVLLDSVASQANRAELALLEGWDLGELRFPVPFVDFTVDEEVADIGKLTVLEAPHRTADAIFRDSLLDGTLFRLTDVGRAITEANPRNATALFKYSPTALLFGMWDSTGPKGGLGSKFQRSYVSEIIGLDAHIGKKVGSRIDPLQIEKLSPEDKAYNHADHTQVWTFDPKEAEKDKGGPKLASRGSEKGDAGQPSKINHGNIPPTIDTLAGGSTISQAIQTTVLSLASLRRLSFAGYDRAAQDAARTAIAALGLAAVAYQHEIDYDLRSRCLLVPEHTPRLELLHRDGSAPVAFEIDRSSAAAILQNASEAAAKAGIGWETREIRLVPAPKLIELIKRSRKVAVTEEPTE